MVLRSWISRFIPNLHCNAMSLVTKPGKDDRLTIDPSNRVSATATPINSMTDIKNEPPITFSTAFVYFLIRLYNLRVTYRLQELLQMSDDASGAFKTTKLHPDVATAFAYAYDSHLCIPSASIFGSNTSPPNFEPIARARTALATALVADPTFDDSTSAFAKLVTYSPPRTKQSITPKLIRTPSTKGSLCLTEHQYQHLSKCTWTTTCTPTY